MKSLKIYLVIIISVFFIGCNKTGDESGGSAETKADIKSFYSLQNKIAAEFQATLSDTITDEFAHSERLLEWILQQPDVVKAEMPFLYVFDVKHTNGFSGNILFTPKQTDVNLITRGGNGKSDGKLHDFQKSDDEKIITNKNVLVIVQYAKQFYAPYSTEHGAKHIQSHLDLYEYADLDFKVTLKVDEGISAFTDLSDYGIIIFNTHGTPTGICSGTEIFNGQELIAFSDNGEVADLPENAEMKLRSGELKLTSLWEYEKATKEMTIKDATYELTFSFFQSLPVQFDNTVLIGNYCYSGINNGIMGDILEPKGLISFYGYGYDNGKSAPVSNVLCWHAEDTIVSNLIARDTTGIAHLANNTTQLQDDEYWNRRIDPILRFRLIQQYSMHVPQKLNHYLDKGYHFERCSDDSVFTDARDGQKYRKVCIGEQKWMAQNLNWNGAGLCYDNIPNNCNTYGRLYSITELTGLETSDENPSTVTGICPKGWHVPSKAEYEELIAFCGGEAQAADMLRSTSGWPDAHSNSTGFDLKPAGHYSTDGVTSIYRYMGYDAKLWTSSKDVSGLYYAVNAYHPGFYLGTYTAAGQEWYFSCRCVED